MAYLDVITLATAKNYLGIDDTLTEDDNDITRMIKGALRYIENFTNVMIYARDKDYIVNNYECRVYDYPINTVNTSDLTATKKPKYTLYTTNDSSVDAVSINVGYATASDVPSDLIDVALEIIELNYYGEKERGAAKKELSDLSKEVLYQYKRFYI